MNNPLGAGSQSLRYRSPHLETPSHAESPVRINTQLLRKKLLDLLMPGSVFRKRWMSVLCGLPAMECTLPSTPDSPVFHREVERLLINLLEQENVRATRCFGKQWLL